ncbi:hypothetical protein niasHT_026626 [Heterodera trifolii]|uniref:Uncharacterized protein n=1 Tax=Heterodera trifolii TaxID=157864 RepID=A0ABD2KSL7_9BILA
MVISPLACPAENALVPKQKRRPKRGFSKLFARHDGCSGHWSRSKECAVGASMVIVSILLIVLCAFRLSAEGKLHPLSHPGALQFIALLSLIAFSVALIIGLFMMLRGCFGININDGSANGGRIC